MDWKVFGVLFFAIACSMLGAGLVVPLLPAYAHGLGATGLEIGAVFAAFSLSRTLLLPLFGRWSDRKGKKPFIIAGLLAYSVASIAYVFSKTVSGLILIRIFQGVASAMVLPVAQAYVGEITPPKKEGLVMGVLNVSLYGGLSLGPLLGGAIADWLGIQASFLSMGMVCLLGFLICSVLLPGRRQELTSRKPAQPASLLRLLRSRFLSALFVFRLTYTMCVGTIWAFAPLLAGLELGLSSLQIGLIISLTVLLSASLMPMMGHLADRLRKWPLVAAGGLLTFLAMLFFYQGREVWHLFAGSILVGLGGGAAMPAIMAMGVQIGRQEASMGSVMALLTMAHSLAMVLGPLLAGLVAEIGELRWVFGVGAAIMLLGTLPVFFLTENPRPAE